MIRRMIMENKLNILDSDTLNLIGQKKAKPDKTIKEHTLELLEVLNLLLHLGYIKNDNIYELVEKACIYHDLGKLNTEFQKRVTGENIKFNENKEDRKSTRLNSSHANISYAVFCLKKTNSC